MKDEKPPAFPLHPGINPGWSIGAGMSLRDHFAGLALVMLPHCGETALTPEEWAHDAYRIADAMLAHRQKGQSDAA